VDLKRLEEEIRRKLYNITNLIDEMPVVEGKQLLSTIIAKVIIFDKDEISISLKL